LKLFKINGLDNNGEDRENQGCKISEKLNLWKFFRKIFGNFPEKLENLKIQK